MDKSKELSALLKQKKSKSFYAKKLKISELEVDNLLNQLKNRDFTEPEGKVEYNLDSGTMRATRSSSTEPNSPEEVIALHNIDTSRWRLSQYWSKEKSNGDWIVSALFSALRPEDIGAEDVKEIINEVFVDKVFKKTVITQEESNSKALFIYTSDKHVAAQTKDNSHYENDYDRSIFYMRMLSIIPEVEYLVSIFGRFEDIFVIDLGDSLDGKDGYTTRGGHRLPQNLTNKEAFRCYLTTHKEFFDILLSSGASNNYHFTVQSEDNHGGDFAYAANESVITYLNAKYPEVKTNITDRFLDHFIYGDHTFILTHGKDSEDLKHGFPLHINDKTENYLNKYIDYHNIQSPHIHVVKGDLHQEAHQKVYGFSYRNVLSLYGMSKWMANNFGPTRPGVSFDIVEKNSPRVFPHYITY